VSVTGTASAALAPQPGRLGIPTSRDGHGEKHSRFRMSKKNERSEFARLEPQIDGREADGPEWWWDEAGG